MLLVSLLAWSWAAAAPAGPAQLSDVWVTHDGVETVVLVVTSRSVRPRVAVFADPRRLVLDFDHTRYAWKRPAVGVAEDPVRDVQGAQLADNVTRLVIELSRDVQPAIRTEDGVLRIALGVSGERRAAAARRAGLASREPSASQSAREPIAAPVALAASVPTAPPEPPVKDRPVVTAGAPVEERSARPDARVEAPAVTEDTAAPTVEAAAGPAPSPAPAGVVWRPGFLRLGLADTSGRWEPAPPPEPRSFRLDTSLSNKGSVNVGDDQWNRIHFQSSQVDLTSGGRLAVFGDLAHQFPYAYSLTGDVPGTQSPQPLRLGFRQAGQGWEYGVDYRSLEPRFEKFAGSGLRKDEAGAQTWAAWRLGAMKLRGFASQTWNNVAEDPAKDRTTKLQGGAGIELALPGSTWLNLSYARGTSERSRDFVTAAQRRRLAEIPRTRNSSIETMSASLYHWTESWDVSLSSSYSPSRDADDPAQQTLSLSHDLSATVRATQKLGFTPALGVWQERQEWTGYQSQGGTASLSLWYGPFLEGHTVTLWGSYDRGRSNDGYWDGQSVNASATLSRRLGRTFLGDAWLSFEVGYNMYLDGVYSSGSYDEVYGKIILRLLDF